MDSDSPAGVQGLPRRNLMQASQRQHSGRGGEGGRSGASRRNANSFAHGRSSHRQPDRGRSTWEDTSSDDDDDDDPAFDTEDMSAREAPPGRHGRHSGRHSGRRH